MMAEVRRVVQLHADQALFWSVADGRSMIYPSTRETAGSLWDRFHDEDGFLYISYCAENVFG
jgi:hypothetical protein